MADLIHDSGGNVAPEQVWDPTLNSGQGGMELVKGSNGAVDVLLLGANSTPVSVVNGPITIPASGAYVSSGTTVQPDWTSVRAAAQVTTSTTANWKLYTLLQSLDNNGNAISGASMYSGGQAVTSGTGQQAAQDLSVSSGLTVFGSMQTSFKINNNDTTNSITLNYGQVHVH